MLACRDRRLSVTSSSESKTRTRSATHLTRCFISSSLKKPSMIDHAMPQFRRDGQGLIHSTQSLWTILGNVVRDPEAGPVILILDALDECDESEFGNLRRNVKSQLGNGQTGNGKLEYLLTSQPYEKIMSQFRDPKLLDPFAIIHIPGEEELEAISQEVDLVITYQVKQIRKRSASQAISRNIWKKDFMRSLIALTSGYTLCLTS